MRIKWLKDAADDLDGIESYILQQGKGTAAAQVVLEIIVATEAIATFPAIGRQGRVDGTRELVIAELPYIVPYRITNNVVEILRVLHTARKWPDNF